MRSLTSDQLLSAYATGLFPMARHRDDQRLYWIDPPERGVLPLDQFHLPRSLRKTVRQGVFTITCDRAFAEVLQGCAEPAPDRPETWINDQILSLFTELHHHGLAHSVEAWRDGKLVGGLYGLSLGAAFFGESMFSREADASKVALVNLVARLRRGGYMLLDTQFVTAHLARFGAREIPRRQYLRLLAEAMKRRGHFYRDLPEDPLSALFAQSITQMS